MSYPWHRPKPAPSPWETVRIHPLTGRKRRSHPVWAESEQQARRIAEARGLTLRCDLPEACKA